MDQGMSMKLFNEVSAIVEMSKREGVGDRYKAFDKGAFENLCREKNAKPSLREPATLISLPDDEEEMDDSETRIEWFQHSMWFSMLVEAASGDKALLHFSVQKQLEEYCSLAKTEYEKQLEEYCLLAKAEVESLTGAAILVVNFVVANHRYLRDVEQIGTYYDEHQPTIWLASVEREKFTHEGKTKFNVKMTFLVDVFTGRELLNAITGFISCPIEQPSNIQVEKVKVVDFYNYSLDK